MTAHIDYSSPTSESINIRIKVAKYPSVLAYALIDQQEYHKVSSYRLVGQICDGRLQVLIYLGYGVTKTLARHILEIGDTSKRVRFLNGDSLDNRRFNLQCYQSGSKREWYSDYGPNWNRIRHEVMDRSNRVCEKCSVCRAIHVHHILPVRFFRTIEEAHFLRNLIAVCKKCHVKEHEGIRANLPLLNATLRFAGQRPT